MSIALCADLLFKEHNYSEWILGGLCVESPLACSNSQDGVPLVVPMVLLVVYPLRYTHGMANVKTAISLQQSLFERVKQLARDLDVPRSRVFVLALEEFIRRHENRHLLKRINAAYEDSSESEGKRLRQMRRSHRRIVKGEW